MVIFLKPSLIAAAALLTVEEVLPAACNNMPFEVISCSVLPGASADMAHTDSADATHVAVKLALAGVLVEEVAF